MDHNYIFRDIYIGWPGSVHDARVFVHQGRSKGGCCGGSSTPFVGRTNTTIDGINKQQNRKHVHIIIIITRNATALKFADPATHGIAQRSFSHDLGTDMWYVCLR